MSRLMRITKRLTAMSLLSFAVAGCSTLMKEREPIQFPRLGKITFDLLCKDVHHSGVNVTTDCLEWEYSLDESEVAALLHYLAEIKRVEALSQ